MWTDCFNGDSCNFCSKAFIRILQWRATIEGEMWHQDTGIGSTSASLGFPCKCICHKHNALLMRMHVCVLGCMHLLITAMNKCYHSCGHRIFLQPRYYMCQGGYAATVMVAVSLAIGVQVPSLRPTIALHGALHRNHNDQCTMHGVSLSFSMHCVPCNMSHVCSTRD